MTEYGCLFISIFITLFAMMPLMYMVRRDKEQIRQQLRKVRARKVRISFFPMGSYSNRKPHSLYKVTYEDAHGKLKRATCRVYILDSTLDWEYETRPRKGGKSD